MDEVYDPKLAGKYGNLQVCKSGAGYYIGRMFHNPEYGGFMEPGSRESGYYPTKEEADIWLGVMQEEGAVLRNSGDVEFMYSRNPYLKRNV